MAHLSYDGLVYLCIKLKERFAPKNHTHDDRYYTENELNYKLTNKADRTIIQIDGDLNDITSAGFYNCAKGNTVTNKPYGIGAFGLVVVCNDNDNNNYTQILTTAATGKTYRRNCVNGTWSSWSQDKYTDTNTWRGIQNNLTSTSTTDSLSAAQGKELKQLVDGKAESGHTHNNATQADGGFMSGDDKKKLDAVCLDELIYAVEESTSGTVTVPINADLLGGLPANRYLKNTDPIDADSIGRRMAEDVIDDLQATKYVVANLTATGWSDSAPYSQSVTISGIDDNWVANIPVCIPPTYTDGSVNMEEAMKILEQVSYINFIESSTNTLKFICPNNKPTLDMSLRITRMKERD